LQHPSLRQFLPGIGWFLLVLVLIIMPKSDIDEMNNWGKLLEKIYFDKWVHAGLFGILAGLFMLPYRKTAFTTKQKRTFFWRIVILTAAWGFCTECIQHLMHNGRSFNLWDWAADSIGAMVAMRLVKKYC